MSIYCKIKKRLGKFLLDVEFEGGEEIIALMGASGCGKSMTLKCIAGIVKPDSGRIVINGVTVFDSEKKINLPPQKRKTGYLFQDYALFPNMTVEKNILTVMAKEDHAKLPHILQKFHLEGLEHHYPSQLSGGQKQRCALARMLVTAPEIVMLDEPFSALDSFLRWQLEQEVVAAIGELGKTVLFVSHDRDEVFRVCDKVVVVEGGVNEAITTKHELYERPKTYTDALLTGCKNIIPVIVRDQQVYAEGFDLDFFHEEATEEIRYLGIRAKQILPAYKVTDEDGTLLLPYEIVGETEGVFSMILMVKIGDSETPLRWELPKEEYAKLRQSAKILGIPKEDLLLLKECL